jgi:hypothetical protein
MLSELGRAEILKDRLGRVAGDTPYPGEQVVRGDLGIAGLCSDVLRFRECDACECIEPEDTRWLVASMCSGKGARVVA